MEVDHQVPGTPLNWAVHHNRPRIIQFLLQKASDAMICLDRATNLVGPSPLEYAAYYHHIECLELMLEALDEAKITWIFEPIIRGGIHSADTFSMILRHGARYKERLHRFLDFCLRKSKNIVFMSELEGSTPICSTTPSMRATMKLLSIS
jgi:ankyrin repeat protein